MARYFWTTIIVFISITLVLVIIALMRQEKLEIKTLKSPITKTILSNEIKDNIEKYSPNILNNLNTNKTDIQNSIDSNIDTLFNEIIEKNIDTYLDFHYSIMGEYIQLGSMALGKMDEIVSEKLLGKDFNNKLNTVSNDILNESYEKIKNHLDFTRNIATKNVDLELNKKDLALAVKNIENNLKYNLMERTATVVVGSAIATKIVSSIATKLSAKIVAKSGTKIGIKLGAKATAASAGATSGLICGPIAPLCGIVAGTVAWFATDAAILSLDELFNKEELKKEIIEALNEIKAELKLQYNPIFDELDEISIKYQEELRKTQTKKRVIDNIK